MSSAKDPFYIVKEEIQNSVSIFSSSSSALFLRFPSPSSQFDFRSRYLMSLMLIDYEFDVNSTTHICVFVVIFCFCLGFYILEGFNVTKSSLGTLKKLSLVICIRDR